MAAIGVPTVINTNSRARSQRLDVTRQATLCACVLALLLLPLGSITHELHFDIEEAHGGQSCVMCVASAQYADHNKACSDLLVDPSIFVEFAQRPLDTQPPRCTLPLDLTARSPPLA